MSRMVISTMTRPQEALAVHRTNYFHSSTFVQLEDGRILHAAGTAFCASDDGGLTWSKPFSCADRDGNRVGGSATSLVRLSGKGIGLAATLIAPDPSGRVEARRRNYLVFWRSVDGGKTWESPVRVTPPVVGCHALQDVLSREKPGSFNQKLKVLPLTWFYGGKPPADNPLLPRAPEPAKP